MKKYISSTPVQGTYVWINLLFLIIIISLVSFDAAQAQVTDTRDDIRELRTNGKSFKHKKRKQDGGNDRSVNCDRLPNRNIDGTCNNIAFNDSDVWGAADVPFFRSMSPAYGAPDFHNDMAGNCRLTARAISNIVVAQNGDILVLEI